MIADAIEKLHTLFRNAQGLVITHDEKTRISYVRKPNGDVVEIPFPPARRAAKIVSMDSLLAAISDAAICSSPEVYVDEDCIRVLPDRTDRNDVITMDLVTSDRFDTITNLRSGQMLTASRLIDLLRFDLPTDASSALIGKLRLVNFHAANTGSSNVQHGREGYGKSVEASVQQHEDIPETVDFTLPVFGNEGLRALSTVTITCGIRIVPQEQGFVLKPLADEIDSAVQTACAQIITHLGRNLDVPVLHGRP